MIKTNKIIGKRQCKKTYKYIQSYYVITLYPHTIYNYNIISFRLYIIMF